MMLIVTIIASTLRLVYLLQNKQKFIFYQEILSLGFILYVMMLFYVVTFQDVSWSSSNFIPFKEMFRYSFGSFLFFKNVIGNMIMFLPYGFFVAYVLKTKKLVPVLLLSFVISCTIETTQLVIGRVFDVDDIMLNVVGGVLGFYFYQFLATMKQHLPQFFQKTWFYNVIVSLLLLGIVFYLYQILKVGL